MKDRQKKIQRILEVQRQIHQAAEWKLAHLERRGAELDEAQMALIRSLNADDALHGLFVDTMARRLNRLSTEAERNEREQKAQAARVLAEAQRVKTTERLSSKLDQEARRADEKLTFRTILDALAKTDASSR